jgi:hypothetical protein
VSTDQRISRRAIATIQANFARRALPISCKVAFAFALNLRDSRRSGADGYIILLKASSPSPSSPSIKPSASLALASARTVTRARLFPASRNVVVLGIPVP